MPHQGRGSWQLEGNRAYGPSAGDWELLAGNAAKLQRLAPHHICVGQTSLHAEAEVHELQLWHRLTVQRLYQHVVQLDIPVKDRLAVQIVQGQNQLLKK